MKKRLGIFFAFASVICSSSLFAIDAEKEPVSFPSSVAVSRSKLVIKSPTDFWGLEEKGVVRAKISGIEVKHLPKHQLYSLPHLLESLSNLTHLSLIGCEYDVDLFQRILRNLTNIKSLQSLTLEGKILDKPCLKMLAKSLFSLENLAELNVWRGGISNKRLKYFAREIERRKKRLPSGLTIISLEYNGLGYRGSSAFIKVLGEQSSVTTLSLVGNPFLIKDERELTKLQAEVEDFTILYPLVKAS